MSIRVNGRDYPLPTPLTVRELLRQLEVQEAVTAVAVNDEVIRKADWDGTEVRDGDRVEVIRIVAGG